jgi:hypothetical protein
MVLFYGFWFVLIVLTSILIGGFSFLGFVALPALKAKETSVTFRTIWGVLLWIARILFFAYFLLLFFEFCILR